MRLPHELRQWAEAHKKEGVRVRLTVLRSTRDDPQVHEAQQQKELPGEGWAEWDFGRRFDREVPLNRSSPLPVPELGLAYHVETFVEEVLGPPASAADGLQKNDVITEVRFREPGKKWGESKEGDWWKLEPENKPDQWAHVFYFLQAWDYKEVGLKVRRNGAVKTIELTARPDATWPSADRGVLLKTEKVIQKADGIVQAVDMGLEEPAASEFELPLRGADSVTAPTLIANQDMSSSVTIPSPRPVAAQALTRSTAILVGAGLVVFLLMASVIGIVAFKWMSNQPSETGGAESRNASPASGAVEGSLEELGRFWLEVEPRPGETFRTTGLEALDSGQSLKFHFAFEEDGYVYIVGPGQGNQPTAFLTARPPAQSGLKNNKVSGGLDLSFPSGSGNWLTLDRNPGTETYTIIFSPNQDSVPPFLNGDFIGTPLLPKEQEELTNFLNRYKDNKASTELKSDGSSSPVVAVKAPPKAAGNPIFFEIRIQHR